MMMMMMMISKVLAGERKLAGEKALSTLKCIHKWNEAFGLPNTYYQSV